VKDNDIKTQPTVFNESIERIHHTRIGLALQQELVALKRNVISNHGAPVHAPILDSETGRERFGWNVRFLIRDNHGLERQNKRFDPIF
jgi:hypothetical protein